ncbi:MAG: hypothetical protein IT357_12620 [Gemmatimonadaceae bacterium]|jgi:hypothetical protein|nr:hypothetical protein [Gemmatimonadaceae bacterium]
MTTPILDPERLVKALDAEGVRFVLVGALGARLFGFPRVTADADITPAIDADNMERLARALRALHARVFTESIPEGLSFDVSAAMLARSSLWNLTCDAGRLDLVFEPLGTRGFDDLATTAVPFDLFGARVLVAPLRDTLRMKEASGRPQDRQDAMLIRSMLQQQNG